MNIVMSETSLHLQRDQGTPSMSEKIIDRKAKQCEKPITNVDLSSYRLERENLAKIIGDETVAL